jgi:formylglycine-generating enzyme required for sulfatase activity
MSSTPDTSIDRRLAAFIEQLRLAGWNIGLQQHLDAQRLLLHGRLVSDAAGIERMLGPILCSSRQEQLEFPRYCRPWAKQLLAPIQPTAPSGPSLAQSTMVAPQPLGDQSPRAAKGQATWSRLRSWLRRHRGNLSAGLVLTFAGWAWLAIPDLRAMVAAIGLLILVGLVLRYGRHLWDAFLTRRSARAQQQLETFRAAGLKDRELHHSPGLARSAQRLRRHVEYATNTLDVPRTVVATIRAGNRLTPVYRRARRTPEYLVLIERLSLVDHQARLASTLVDHLRQNEQVAIDTYYFDRDPRYCTADRNGLPARSLADLKTRYPHHRLLIFADAGGFFDPYSGAPQSWIGALRSWHDRALFPLARAAPQADLHGLAADYGMLVLRADEHGIAAFAERDDRARRRIPSVDDAILEPPGILTRLPQRWLAPAPPAEPAQDALVNALERYLGDDGFIWLAACAVYPELHWPLTLELSRRLRIDAPAGLLARLAPLPWLRHGYIPDWLREALLDALGEQELRVRHEVERLIRPTDGPGLRLQYLPPPQEDVSAIRLPLSVAARDAVFLSFVGERLAVRIPRLRRRLRRWWRQLLPRASTTVRSALMAAWKRRVSPALSWARSRFNLLVWGTEALPGRFADALRTLSLPRPLRRIVASRAAVGHDEGAIAGEKPRVFRERLKLGDDGPEMVWLPGGKFTIGSPDGVGEDREHPAHRVQLSHYAVGRFPVTVGEFRRFIEATGYVTEAEQGDGAWVWNRGDPGNKVDASWHNPYMDQDDNHPVICISWNDAKAYCDWLSEETGQPYGLLSEAQWENACRAGEQGRWCFGDDEDGLDDYAWYGSRSGDGTHSVGTKRPNDWQLHDMHGNVWEWCADWFNENTYKERAARIGEAAESRGDSRGEAAAAYIVDPTGPETGSNRVVRGGSWGYDADLCRSAYRDGYGPSSRFNCLGFRLSRTGPLHSYPFTLGGETKAPAYQDGLRDPLQDGSQGPAMVWLRGGQFTMGQDDSQWDWEKPAHPVEVSAFSIGQYPLTFDEYDRFCESTGRDKPSDEGWGRGRRPVINISWDDARAYCDWLNGQQETGTYRLLTEAEWEFACRAGSETRWSCGDTEKQLVGYAWYRENAEGKTHPVGEKKPNAWKLHDMHGNVWEWCADWFDNNTYKEHAAPTVVLHRVGATVGPQLLQRI